jgi:hypothetical protein
LPQHQLLHSEHCPLTKQLVKHALRHLHVPAARARCQQRSGCLCVWLHAQRCQASQLLHCLLELALLPKLLDAACDLLPDFTLPLSRGLLLRWAMRCVKELRAA